MDVKILDLSIKKEEPEVKKVVEAPKLDLNINEEKIPEKIPTLYEINKSFDVIKVKNHEGLKGEYFARMVVFTNFILGKKSILLTGPRASGKTAIMMIIGTYAKNPGDVRKSSERADYRDSNLNEYSHFIIPEINKISDSFVEVLKDIGEGEISIYKTLDAYKMPVVYKIDPKPFISSIADENSNRLGEELISRLTTVRTDSSIEQNISVISYKFEKAQNPFARKEVTQAEVKAFQNYVKNLPDINDFTFIYLPGKSVLNAIPPFFTDSRRDTDKYLFNTYGITLFHLHDRMVINKRNKKLLLVTPADAWYNHIIFSEIIVQSSLKCSGIEKVILELLSGVDEQGNKIRLSSKGIHDALVQRGYTPNLPTIKRYCQNLYENGYIIRNEEKKPFTYESGDYMKEFMASIDWKAVVAECKRAIIEQFDKETAEEYVRRYCTEPIIVINPFTGEKINLIDYKEPEKKPIEKKEKTESGEKTLDEFEETNDISTEITKDIIEDLSDDGDEENENGMVGKDGRDYVKYMIEEADDSGFVDAMKFEENFSEEYARKLIINGDVFEGRPGKYKTLN